MVVYQGSKARYAKYIIPILQNLINKNNIDTFIDGMCGGCNIIDKIEVKNRIAYDLNNYLIDLYNKAVYDNIIFPTKIDREEWDSCKNNPEDNPKWKVALVAFFCSYSARGFCGGYALNGKRDYYTERLNNFKKQIPLLKGIHFETKDIYDLNTKNCLIYLDPPYKNTKKYDISKNFNSEKFWGKVRELSKDNIVIVSEQEAPEDFDILWEKEIKRNCFGNGHTSVYERLFIIKGAKYEK